MDFYKIRERPAKSGVVEIYPEFLVTRSRDLMIQAKTFAGIWDEEKGLWSTDEYDVARLVDESLDSYFQKNKERLIGTTYVKYMRDFSSGTWSIYRSWLSKLSDNAKPLDQKLIFADTPVRKEDYASKRLPYSLVDEFPESWDALIGRLYSPEEREKIEWAIGAVLSGDSKKIQKFLVLYGEKGTGKSTVLDIVQKLFAGYYTVFEAKALGQSGNQFATESFKNSPLVAIQHDGDLSRIEDNTRLNSIVSHEEMVINEKNKPLYNAAVNAFLFMGTNHPVRITDAKSGIIRRLIDATPTGERFSINEYDILVTGVGRELGAIAHYCLSVYRSMGKNYYRDYIPMAMMQKTDVFYNFIEYVSVDLIENDPITLKRAWDLYKAYVDETRLEWTMPMYKFREALKDYYEEYDDRKRVDDKNLRNVYSGFKRHKLEKAALEASPEVPYSLTLDSTTSLLDQMLKDCPAQYASKEGTPVAKWDDVTTTLGDLRTDETHFVRIPDLNHIVVDFDLKDPESGEKSKELNLEAASKFPPTYAEYSKGGSGVHLHYLYEGDPEELSSVYSPGIEVKVFPGKSSLRRRVSFCNEVPVSSLPEDFLPLKEKKVINKDYVMDEQKLRDMIERNLRKEFHGATKPSVDFIKKLLDEAYESGMHYDVSDLKPKVMAFAISSTNQANAALRVFADMQFTGKGMEPDEVMPSDLGDVAPETELIFFDIEVYPNLFLVCYKKYGSDIVTPLINPGPDEIEVLIDFPLVGFNNRRYDNHILYARYMGASNEDLYRISNQIINGNRDAMSGNAYNLSYTDVYDFASAGNKMSLKKWEIKLGLPHMEMDIPWDQPVPDDKIQAVIEYCANDVKATEALFDHLHEDWNARKILADIAGMTPNTSTNALTQKIIFGDDRNPPFVWTDLSEEFPGYEYKRGKSTYRGEEVGEGGYVYAEPGIYEDVALLDIASMHPASLIALNCFGDTYTQRFKDLRDGRIAVKHNDRESASKLLGGALAPFMSNDPDARTGLANALKTAINSVYGLTSAKFPNRANGNNPNLNKDNIVAKRGALFMIDLKHFIQEQGFTVAHIKTDSVKIPGGTPELIDSVIEFGKKYGYDFEHEATYSKMCLVNDAVYIAKDEDGWHATGAQFQHPVVYKTLFTDDALLLSDYFETKQVTTALYLDWSKNGVTELADDSDLEFVGRVGLFAPVKDGAILLREKENKLYSATGSKGYKWTLADRVKDIDQIDLSYSRRLVDEARAAIGKYGDLEEFLYT